MQPYQNIRQVLTTRTNRFVTLKNKFTMIVAFRPYPSTARSSEELDDEHPTNVVAFLLHPKRKSISMDAPFFKYAILEFSCSYCQFGFTSIAAK